MTAFIMDLRHAARALRRAPWLFTAAVLSLAVGIGANTTVFSWMDNLVLHPFPGLREPDRLVGLEVLDGSGDGGPVSLPMLRQWTAESRSFAGVSAWSVARVSARREGERSSTSLIAFTTSGNYFSVLGGGTVLGRPLRPDDEAARSPVAVLGWECFRRQFASDSSILGRALYLNGQPVTVVGVAAPRLLGTYLGVVPDLFVPLTMHPALTGTNSLDDRGARGWQAVARLVPGATVASVQQELDSIARRQSRAMGDRPVTGALVQDARTQYLGGVVFPLFIALLVVTALLLLVACANVAGLLLVRATGRSGEMSLRLAIGGSSGQLARLALLESGMLAVAAAASGCLLAYALRNVLTSFVPTAAYPITLPLDINARVLGFAMATGMVVALICGIIPVLRASRTAPIAALRGASGATSPVSLRSRFAIVAAQIAFSMLCLVTAGVFARGVRAAAAIDPGFRDPEHVLLLNTDLGPTRASGDRGTALLRQALGELRTMPGVGHATASTMVPLGFGGRRTVQVHAEGRALSAEEDVEVLRAVVGTDYAGTMGIRVVEGRGIEERDDERSLPVALVNQTFARRYWPGASAVGRRFDAGRGLVTVVGVLADGKYGSLAEAPQSVAYFPLAQWPQASVTIHLHSSGNPRLLAEPARRVLQRVHPDLPALQPRTLAEHIAASTFVARVGASVLSAFGALALLLSVVGLYAATAFVVVLRTRELGVRMALGASARDVVRCVAAPAARATSVGVSAGVALALLLGRALHAKLPFVSAIDPVPLAGAVLLLGLATLVAAWVPAVRALRLPAAAVLRDA